MGFWVATAKSNTSNMKINHPPPPHLLVRRSGLPAGDWSGASGKYTGSTKGCGKAKVGNLAGSCKEDRDLCVSAIIVCVCVWVFVGDQRACDLNS